MATQRDINLKDQRNDSLTKPGQQQGARKEGGKGSKPSVPSQRDSNRK